MLLHLLPLINSVRACLKARTTCQWSEAPFSCPFSIVSIIRRCPGKERHLCSNILIQNGGRWWIRIPVHPGIHLLNCWLGSRCPSSLHLRDTSKLLSTVYNQLFKCILTMWDSSLIGFRILVVVSCNERKRHVISELLQDNAHIQLIPALFFKASTCRSRGGNILRNVTFTVATQARCHISGVCLRGWWWRPKQLTAIGPLPCKGWECILPVFSG